MKRLLTVFLSVTVLLIAHAQKPLEVQNQDGIIKYFGTDKNQNSPTDWKANWIWRAGQPFADNVMLCARKSFNLSQKPATSKLYITADSHYTLWVNGDFIGRGPARSAPHHQSFDVLDIASKLKAGKNIIAIKVHHSDYTLSYLDKPRPGLLFQLEIPQQALITSDVHVKVRNEAGWDTETPQVDQSNTARVENFDFRKSAVNWEQPGFDDSGWENAILVRQTWWPPPKDNSQLVARMPPWHTLVPRDLPYLEETMKPVKTVLETGECAEFGLGDKGAAIEHLPVLGVMLRQIQPLKLCKIENIEGFVQQKNKLVIQNYSPETLYKNDPFRSTWIVFDLGEIMHGYPSLNIEASRGTNVDICYATVLINGRFNAALIPDNGGDRIILPGKQITWNAQELRTMRYIGFLVSNTDKPVTISRAGIRQTFYPFKDSAAEESGDITLNKMMEASRKTMKVITHDAYTDNYRERRQYIQTAFYAARCSYNLFGDPYLMRRCLIQTAQDQSPNGYMPMHAPGNGKPNILEADFMWHMSLYDYYMYTGDHATTNDLLLNLKRSLLALEDLGNKNGLIENPPHSYWIDHADIDRRGINFTLNAWYMIALENDAKLFTYFGDSREAGKCLQKANKIRQYLKEKFWNKEKNLFVQTEISGKQTDNYDEITNGIALITGIADGTQAQAIATKILKNDQTREMVRPTLMMYWVIEGLFKTGYGKEAIELIKFRYKDMLQHENGTLWESWNLFTMDQSGTTISRIQTSTQAEQVYAPDIFNRNIIGLKILKPGMKEVEISYHDYGIKNMKSVVPTPLGNITVSWSLNDKGSNLDITSPKSINVILNKQRFPKGIKINKQMY